MAHSRFNVFLVDLQMYCPINCVSRKVLIGYNRFRVLNLRKTVLIPFSSFIVSC